MDIRPPLLLLASSLLGACAMPGEGFRYGPESQAYPAGVIVGLQGQWALDEHDVAIARAAVNVTERQDFGEHDNEDGEGFGLGVGWRRYADSGQQGWLYGARLDLFYLDIAWRDDLASGGTRRGSTDVTVLQPTLEGGYAWRLDEHWSFDLTVGLGAEINLNEQGEEVGDGAILLLGFAFLYDG